MEERIKTKPILTKIDKMLEVLGWLAVLAIWLLTLTSYPKLPDTIPIHYNLMGEADGFGEKSMLFFLPLIATALFIGLTYLSRYPHVFNYPVSITAANALQHYTNAVRMLRVMKLSIVIVFGLLILKTIQLTNGQTIGIGLTSVPLMLALIFIPITYFMAKAFSIK